MPDMNPFLIVLLQNQLGVLLECSFDEVHGALRHWAVFGMQNIFFGFIFTVTISGV